jgi:hypothetical protein
MGDSLEVLATAIAHASTGAVVGGLVDSLFPKLEAEVVPPGTTRKGTMTIFAEVMLQFSLGYLGMAEAMRILTPAQQGYQSPIGDGTSVFFYFYMQPRFWSKVNHLRRAVVGDAELALGYTSPKSRNPVPVRNAPAGTIGGENAQPAPTGVAPED